MTTGALLFMAASWTFVLGLMGWSYARVLRPKPEPPAVGSAVEPARRNGRVQR